ncbi:Protein of unknown function, partial [Cotesia congregata]
YYSQDEEAETKSSIEINERRPLGNIQNGLLESNDHTPNRDGSDLSIKSEASKGMENTLIRRKKMQGIKGIGWRRRAEQRMIRMEEQIEEVIKINKNDEKFVGNTVNLEESIVIENGEQITKIQGVAFTKLCLHLQHRRKILFKKGSADDLEIYSKTWLARRCTEL